MGTQSFDIQRHDGRQNERSLFLDHRPGSWRRQDERSFVLLTELQSSYNNSVLGRVLARARVSGGFGEYI
jgi:hypothetical protein